MDFTNPFHTLNPGLTPADSNIERVGIHGQKWPETDECSSCGGTGLITRQNVSQSLPDPIVLFQETCPACGGSGKRPQISRTAPVHKPRS